MPGLIHHSALGSQYCSYDYRASLEDIRETSNMKRRGNCWDNALLERWFNSLENAQSFHQRYQSRNEAKA